MARTCRDAVTFSSDSSFFASASLRSRSAACRSLCLASEAAPHSWRFFAQEERMPLLRDTCSHSHMKTELRQRNSTIFIPAATYQVRVYCQHGLGRLLELGGSVFLGRSERGTLGDMVLQPKEEIRRIGKYRRKAVTFTLSAVHPWPAWRLVRRSSRTSFPCRGCQSTFSRLRTSAETIKRINKIGTEILN